MSNEDSASSPVDDLFGHEELDLGGESPPPAPARRRRGGGGRLSWMLIAGAALVVFIIFYFLSSANSERFYVVVDDNTVSVERGMFFPFGSSAWRPNRAYEPVRLPEGVGPTKTGAMTAEEADRVLLDLFVTVAEREVRDLEKGDPDLAEDMLLRGNKLNHITVHDDRRLLSMMGDVSFRRGLTEIRGIQARFDEALEQFQLAAQRGGHTWKGARQWVDAIERLRSEFRALSARSGIDPDKVLASPLVPQAPEQPTADPDADEDADEKADEAPPADAGVADAAP